MIESEIRLANSPSMRQKSVIIPHCSLETQYSCGRGWPLTEEDEVFELSHCNLPASHKRKSSSGYCGSESGSFERRTLSQRERQMEMEEESEKTHERTDTNPKRRTMRKIFTKFAERTSMQGVPYISTSSTVVGKLLWVSILLICFILLSGHLYYLCSIYYSYPKHSTVELGFSALPFPAVTFCNANPVRRSHLFMTSKELRVLVSKTDTDEVIKKLATENGPRLKQRKKRTPEDEDSRMPTKGRVRPQQTASSLDISNFTSSANNRTDRDTLWTPQEIVGLILEEMWNKNKKESLNNEDDDRRGSWKGDELTDIAKNSTKNNDRRFRSVKTAGTRDNSNDTSGSPLNRNSSQAIDNKRSSVKTLTQNVSKQDEHPSTDFRFNGTHMISANTLNITSVVSWKPVNVSFNGTTTTPKTYVVSRKNEEKEDDEYDDSKRTNGTHVLDNNDGLGSRGNKRNSNISDDDDKNSNDENNQDRNKCNCSTNNNRGDTQNDKSNASEQAINVNNGIKDAKSRETNDSDVDLNAEDNSNKKHNKSGDNTKKEDGTDKKSRFDFVNDLDLGVNLTHVDKLQKIKDEEEVEAGAQVSQELFSQPSVTASIREEFMYLYSIMDRSIRNDVGHQLADMLVDCSFAGKYCHPQNFTLESSTAFGNCFTLDFPRMVASRSGSQGGLALTLFLENDEYLRGVTSGTGIQVTIHPHNTLSFPEENGLAIMAGTETNIALRLLNINRLGPPHGACDNGEDLKTRFHREYTRRTCQYYCEQETIIKQCSCYSEQNGDNIIHALENELHELHPCRSDSELRCMLKIQTRFQRGDTECECHDPCFENAYYKTLSMHQWPSDEYAAVLLEALCVHRNATECEKYRQSDLRTLAQSFVKLNIFYEDLNYENITEVEDYELSQFASDVGGTIGLWLGMSILSGFEIMHLLMELVAYFVSFPCVHRKDNSPRAKKESRNHHHHHSDF